MIIEKQEHRSTKIKQIFYIVSQQDNDFIGEIEFIYRDRNDPKFQYIDITLCGIYNHDLLAETFQQIRETSKHGKMYCELGRNNPVSELPNSDIKSVTEKAFMPEFGRITMGTDAFALKYSRKNYMPEDIVLLRIQAACKNPREIIDVFANHLLKTPDSHFGQSVLSLT